MKNTLRTVWGWYLVPGFLLGGVKFFSVFTWFFFSPVAAFLGLSESSPSFIVAAGTLMSGFVGAALATIAWPLSVWGILSGQASLTEMLFYPWVT
ncbi:MAG: hypothetical protein M3Q08_00710 [Pseudomonadota bacterium]|nr:hypothetical protein [Pseudomonadota bacterium]